MRRTLEQNRVIQAARNTLRETRKEAIRLGFRAPKHLGVEAREAAMTKFVEEHSETKASNARKAEARMKAAADAKAAEDKLAAEQKAKANAKKAADEAKKSTSKK